MEKVFCCFVVAVMVTLATGQSPSTVSDTSTTAPDGYNFCDENRNDSCSCDVPEHHPRYFHCEGIGLRLVYEQSDFQATFDALNISMANTTLDIRFDNNLIEVIERFPPLPIVALSFHRNRVSKIDEFAFCELKHLDLLDLSFNQLTSESLFEGVFFGPNATNGYFPIPLKHLNLSHNNIHSFQKNAFEQLQSLVTLDLSHNPLKVLSGSTSQALSSLRGLQYLGLAFTQVNAMHEGMLHDLNKLTALDLSGNEFVKVPQELRLTHSLEVLSLEQNKFETLDQDSFLGLDKLKDLSLVRNEKLKSVEPHTFAPLKSLNRLDLSFCKRLETISDDAFEGLVEKENVTSWPLKEIRLNDNGISNIDEGLLPWDQVDAIVIQNNPFRCDCNLEWMLKTLIKKIDNTNPMLTTSMNCAQPKAMRGKRLIDLMAEPDLFLRCKDNKDELFPEEISLIQSGSYRTAGITILVISVLLALAGVSVVVFIVVKRRAIAKALATHQEIRYERAESDDDGIGGIHSSTGKNRRF